MMIPADEVEKLIEEVNKIAPGLSTEENMDLIKLTLKTYKVIAPAIVFLEAAKVQVNKELALDLAETMMFGIALSVADSTDEAILMANKLKEEIINADKKIVGD